MKTVRWILGLWLVVGTGFLSGYIYGKRQGRLTIVRDGAPFHTIPPRTPDTGVEYHCQVTCPNGCIITEMK